MTLLPLPAPLYLLAQVMGGVLSPTCPRTSSPVTLLSLVATPGVSSPRGNASNPGVSMPCGDSTPPPTLWPPPPPGVFRYSIGLAASSVAPHSGRLAIHSVGLAPTPLPPAPEDLPAGFS